MIASNGIMYVLFERFVGQVTAAWQWFNFYNAKSGAKQLIKINLDETSIPCYRGRPTGAVFKRINGRVFDQSLPNSKRRKFLTLVAVITDEPTVQRYMPQFVIGNFHTFLKRDMHLLAAAGGGSVVLIRCVSSHV